MRNLITIIVMVLILCNRASSELMDVTTIYHPGGPPEVVCIARTNALGFSFKALNGSTIDPQGAGNIPSCHVEMNGSCPWEALDWDVVSSSAYNLPPFAKPLEVKLTTTGLGMSDLVPLTHPLFHIRVHITKVGLARILLLQGQDVASSDLYVIDLVHQHLPQNNETSMVLQCSKYQEFHRMYSVVPGERGRNCQSVGNFYVKWEEDMDVTVRVEISRNILRLWRPDQLKPLIETSTMKNFTANYLAVVSRHIKLNWTVTLEANVLMMKEYGGWLRSPVFTHMSNNLCLSFFSYLVGGKGTSLEVAARINDTRQVMGRVVYSSNYSTPTDWSLERFLLDMDGMKGSKVELIVQGFKEDPEDMLAVHTLMGCTVASPITASKEEVAVIPLMVEDPNTPFICEVIAPSFNDAITRGYCKDCDNGGVCDPISFLCACPPGFVGDRCEDGCGHNRYGGDCEGRCSGSKDGCKGLRMCAALVGCECGPGYHGSSCNTDCTNGSYGSGCAQRCGSCKDNAFCDVYSGVCLTGCEHGYYAPLCKQTYKYLLSAPIVSNVTYNEALVSFNCSENNLAGVGYPKFFQLQYKVDGEESRGWQEEPAVLLPANLRSSIRIFLTGLRAGMFYHLRVLLIDRDGNFYSDENVLKYTNFSTPCGLPEYPIYNLEVEWVKVNAFAVSWQYQLNSSSSCERQYFNVYLKEGWSRKWQLLTATKYSNITIENRSPNSMHWVQVEAVTQLGAVPKSEVLVATTKEGVPSVVVDLNFREISPTELEISWSHPRHRNGVIRFYLIKHKCLQYLACDNANCDQQQGEMTSTNTTITLQNLAPHSQYEVQVAASTLELGPFTSISAVTPFAEPGAAPEASNTPVIHRTISTLTFDWGPVVDCRLLHGFRVGYIYSLLSVDEFGKRTEELTGNTTRPPLTIRKLRPFYEYELHVWQMVTGGLYNRNHKLVIKGKTRAVVAPPVRDLEAVNITGTTATITWEIPPSLNPMNIKLYNVTYQCKRLKACPNDDTCSEQIILTTDTNKLFLEDLKPYAIYRVTVAIFSGEFGVPTSINFTTTTTAQRAVPTIEDNPIIAFGRSWFEVRWLPPADCSLLHGPLVGYKLRLLSYGDILRERRISGSILTANFTELSPYNKYKVELYVITGTDDESVNLVSAESLIINVTTKPPEPLKVEDLMAYRRAANHLGFRFKIPVYRFGLLDSATVIYQEDNGTRREIDILTQPCSIWINLTCFDLQDLKADTNYTVTVSVWNSNAKEKGHPSTIRVMTRETAPSYSTFLHLVNKSENGLDLECGIPNILNGVLRSFHVETQHFSSYNPKYCCNNVTSKDVVVKEEKLSYIIKVRNLRPTSSYVISVSAVTNQRGPPLILKGNTLPPKFLVTHPPRVLSKFITSTSADVIVWPPVNIQDGPVSALFVVVKTPGPCKDIGFFDSMFIRDEVAKWIGPNSYVALELHEAEVGEFRAVMLGNGEEYLGMHGSFINMRLLPATNYTAQLLVMSSYKGSNVFGSAESQPFTTLLP